jgi:hypothetical protein
MRACRAAQRWILAAVVSSLAASPGQATASADRVVSGPIAQDTTWSRSDGPIVVVGDVTVAEGATLTIEPGVEVRFEGGHTLTVLGTLRALGLPGNGIVWVVGGRRVLEIDSPVVVRGPQEARADPPRVPLALARDLSFDAGTGEVLYTLPEPALVRIRIGVRDGGPLLRTLVDWEPRKAGRHREVWDGRDGSGLVDFGRRRDLLLVLACLPADPASVQLEEVRGRRKAPRFAIEFPGAGAGGVLRGSAPVRVAIAPEDFAWLGRMDFELALYVDTEFVYEHEEGGNPIDYSLDTASLAPGLHSLTVNVIGYEGEIGTRSVRFRVD